VTRPISAQIHLSLCAVIRAIVLLFAVLPVLLAQEQPPADTLHSQLADSLRPATRKQPFMPKIGAISRSVDTLSTLHRSQFQHTDAAYVGDLLWKVPGVFIRDFGEPGQVEQLSIAGVGVNGIALLLDGRPLNDPVQRGYNLYDIPFEYVETVELVEGPRSLLFGTSSPGGVLNVVSQQYNTIRPRTKLRFLQGATEHVLTDGMFTQNIIRGVNALVGIQRHVTDGRFANAAYDSWNVRTRFRYDPSEQFCAWVSEVYTKATIGLNGGVDPVKSPVLYDDVTASVLDLQSYQITARHDLTLGAVGSFLNDSTQRTHALLYYSTLDREYSIGGGQGAAPVFSNLQASSYWGFRVDQSLRWSFAAILIGAQLENRSVGQSHFLPSTTEKYSSAMGGVTLDPAEWIRGDVTVRQEQQGALSARSWGTSIRFDITPWFSLVASHGVSHRFPTIQDLFWSDSILTRPNSLTEERHRLTEIGLEAKAEQAEISLVGFRRLVENALTYSQTASIGDAGSVRIENIPSIEISGARAEVRLRLWKFTAEGNVSYTNYKAQGRSSLQIPRLISTGEFSFRDLFFKEELDLKVAVRWKAVTHHLGLQFVPRMLIAAQQENLEMPAFTRVDLCAVAKIGDAYLTLTLENPLNTNMMVLPFYPLMKRNFQLGVNWEFTD
jgi:outer membrane cobalamin receptor